MMRPKKPVRPSVALSRRLAGRKEIALMLQSRSSSAVRGRSCSLELMKDANSLIFVHRLCPTRKSRNTMRPSRSSTKTVLRIPRLKGVFLLIKVTGRCRIAAIRNANTNGAMMWKKGLARK